MRIIGGSNRPHLEVLRVRNHVGVELCKSVRRLPEVTLSSCKSNIPDNAGRL
jgi:hypothetical protein